MDSFQKHISTVVKETRDGDKSSREQDGDPIKQSWLRCVNEYDMDPERPEPAHILPAQEIIEHKGKIDEFLHVARIGMEGLYKHVASLDYLLLLTDSSGVAVDFIGDSKFDAEFKKAGLYLGADWNEARAGTNGVGTCLQTQQTLICHQTDHFHATHIDLTCTASPVFDPNGDLLAVLDVSALKASGPREGQLLVSQLTMMYAKRIESANFLRHFQNNWVLRFATTPEFIDVSTDNLIAIDGEGIILGATQSAASSLQESGSVKSIVGNQILDFFDCVLDDIFSGSSRVKKDSHTRVLMTKERNELFYVSLTEPRSAKPGLVKVDREAKSYTALDSLTRGDRAMERAIGRAKRLLNNNVNIIVGGETGTGKEVMARALHDSSDRANKPFVAVNCAAIPESLIESELFGYKSGSFTGARGKGMVGLIMQSNGGTLFLDEIGDMPLQLQSRLLRTLAEKEVMPVGATKPESVDLHVISASHRDLRVLISEGSFREDLYYRLNGAILNLPALRDREDISFIVEKILNQETNLRNLSVEISASAMSLMCQYSWPGNLRQLRNAIQFSLAVCEGGIIMFEDLPDEISLARQDQSVLGTCTDTKSTTDVVSRQIEKHYPSKVQQLIDRLHFYKWNITAVSEDLGVSRSTIYRRMERHNIIPPNLE